jgi:hypothetical protein
MYGHAWTGATFGTFATLENSKSYFERANTLANLVQASGYLALEWDTLLRVTYRDALSDWHTEYFLLAIGQPKRVDPTLGGAEWAKREHRTAALWEKLTSAQRLDPSSLPPASMLRTAQSLPLRCSIHTLL